MMTEPSPTSSPAGFLRPTSLEEALAARASGGWRVLAGGTDLYAMTAAPSLEGPVLDVTAIEGMRGIRETDEGLVIGAATPWRLIRDAAFPPAVRALAEAAAQVGGRQIQAGGAIGGNLCNASPAADGVPPLMALDAEVTLRSTTGERRMPVGDFLTGPRQTALRPDELLTEITLPRAALTGASAFEKLGARAHLVISIVMTAARITVADGAIASAALAIGACSPVARRLSSLEARLIGAPAEPAAIAAILTEDAIAPLLAPIDDPRADAGYRRRAAAEMMRRAAIRAAAAA